MRSPKSSQTLNRPIGEQQHIPLRHVLDKGSRCGLNEIPSLQLARGHGTDRILSLSFPSSPLRVFISRRFRRHRQTQSRWIEQSEIRRGVDPSPDNYFVTMTAAPKIKRTQRIHNADNLFSHEASRKFGILEKQEFKILLGVIKRCEAVRPGSEIAQSGSLLHSLYSCIHRARCRFLPPSRLLGSV